MTLILLICIYIQYKIFKKNIVVLVFLFSSFFYVIIPIFCYEIGLDGQTALGKLLNISNIYIIGLLYSILIPLSSLILSKIKVPVNYYHKQQNLKLLFVISCLLLLLYYLNLISEYNNIFDFFLVERIERYSNDLGNGQYVFILQSLPYLFGYIIFNEKNSFLRKTSIAILVVLILFILILGERRIAFSFLLFGLVYSYNLKIITFSNLKRIILISSSLVILMGITRNYTSNLLNDEDFEISENIIESRSQLLINGENTNHFIINDYIIKTNRKLLLGSSYLNSFPILLPSLLIRERPKTFGTNFSKFYLGIQSNRSKYASSLLGESIANWGLFFAIPFLLLFLILMVLFINISLQILPERSKLFYYSLLIPVILVLFRIDSNNLTRMFVYNIILLTVLITILSLNRKLKKNG